MLLSDNITHFQELAKFEDFEDRFNMDVDSKNDFDTFIVKVRHPL